MTDQKKLKKEVRERMARTGESYTVAHRALQLGLPEPVSQEGMTDEEVLLEYGEHLGLPKA